MYTKVYIASPFFTPIQLDRVERIENRLFDLCIDFFSPRSFGSLQTMTIEEKREASKKIYNSNVDNIRKCTVLLAVLDDRDTGTIFELGYAAAYARQLEDYGVDDYLIVSMSFVGKGLNVMLRECVDTHISHIHNFNSVFRAIKENKYLPKFLDEGDIE